MYIKGKENHVADALSRIKIEQTFFGESTQQSAEKDSSKLLGLSEKAINYHKRQVIFSNSPNSNTEHETYFKKETIHIFYEEMTLETAKQYLLKHFSLHRKRCRLRNDSKRIYRNHESKMYNNFPKSRFTKKHPHLLKIQRINP